MSAQNEPAETEYDQTLTDVDGRYSLRVRPGTTNSVYAYDPANTYVAMTYNGRSSCGCDFDPVTSTLATPATGINFDLVALSAAKVVQGLVVDESNGPLSGINVRLYRASGNGWVLADEATSDGSTSGPNFGYYLNETGTYRLQFIDNGGHILSVVAGFVASGLTGPTALDPVPACYANLGDVEVDTEVLAEVDSGTAAGACSNLPAPSTPSSGGSTPVVIHKHHSSPSVTSTFPIVAPTPTPTPSATPSAEPEPSSSPTAVAGGSPKPTQSAPDLWWLLWLGLALLVLIIVGGAIFLFRRA